jgi:2',3'-cyclic-nucleotide 2'-phosphodiesterase (5'-nucleotidase family)
MAENEVKNTKNTWYIAWALILVGAVFAASQALAPKGPSFEWRVVAMDGHRIQAKPVTADNVPEALGVFKDSEYVAPSGVVYPLQSDVARSARVMVAAQTHMSTLKVVIGHSDAQLENLRTNPDLPLGNLFADALRSYGSEYFKVPMDFAITNFGGIRIPMPKGDVTLDDISSMLPFKNYMVYVRMKGSALTTLFEQLAKTKAFQATSGATIRVKAHKLESALIGGKPIDPDKVYNVTTIDFLLDGGDQINIGALAESVKLSRVLLKDVMLHYIRQCDARGEMIHGQSDGRVIMED